MRVRSEWCGRCLPVCQSHLGANQWPECVWPLQHYTWIFKLLNKRASLSRSWAPGYPVAGASYPAPTWLTAMWDPHNGLMDWIWTKCTGPSFNMEQSLWTLALLLALLEPQLHSFRTGLRTMGLWNLRNVTPTNTAFYHISFSHGGFWKCVFQWYLKNHPTPMSIGEI